MPSRKAYPVRAIAWAHGPVRPDRMKLPAGACTGQAYGADHLVISVVSEISGSQTEARVHIGLIWKAMGLVRIEAEVGAERLRADSSCSFPLLNVTRISRDPAGNRRADRIASWLDWVCGLGVRTPPGSWPGSACSSVPCLMCHLPCAECHRGCATESCRVLAAGQVASPIRCARVATTRSFSGGGRPTRHQQGATLVACSRPGQAGDGNVAARRRAP